jgi:hypothetical protein
MASIRTYKQFAKAQAVLAIANTLMDEDLPATFDIYVSGHGAGLSLQLWDGSRKCHIRGHGNSDSIIVITGSREDFEYPSGDAKESAETHAFPYSGYYDAAVVVVDWLCKGEINYEESAAGAAAI